eukprot:scaffold510312_cov55-Attheya_sp.AAC.1
MLLQVGPVRAIAAAYATACIVCQLSGVPESIASTGSNNMPPMDAIVSLKACPRDSNCVSSN